MKCSKCGKEMMEVGAGHYKCIDCNIGLLTIDNIKKSAYIKQGPRIDEDGIWEPCDEYVPEGCESNYRLIMSKEMFIEAYNKYIKGE